MTFGHMPAHITKEDLEPMSDQDVARCISILGTNELPDESLWTTYGYDAMVMMLAQRACAFSMAFSHPPVIVEPSEALIGLLDATDVADIDTENELNLPFDFFVVRLEGSPFLVSKIDLQVDDNGGLNGLNVVELMCVRTAQGRAFTGQVRLIHKTMRETEKTARDYHGAQAIFDTTTAIIRRVIALCLYMDTEAPDVVLRQGRIPLEKHDGKIILPPMRSRKKLRARKKLKKLIQHRKVLVGSRLEPLKVHANTLVRGHFRRQAHGPRHSLRKTIWIKPHLRYKDENYPVLGRDYVSDGK